MNSGGFRPGLRLASCIWAALLIASIVVVLAWWNEPAGARDVLPRPASSVFKNTIAYEPALHRSIAGSSVSTTEGQVLINEVQYLSTTYDSDPAFQWFELYNNTDGELTLNGWSIANATGSDMLPNITLAPRGFAVVAASTRFNDEYSNVRSLMVYLDGTIGSGLDAIGDHLILRDTDGTAVDAVNYGADASGWLNPPCSAVPAGYSLERVVLGLDTDSADDFVPNPAPSPGRGPILPLTPTPSPTSQTQVPGPTASMTPSPISGSDATPTPTATTTARPSPSATATATASATPIGGAIAPGEILINEVQYQAGPVTGGGEDSDHEWVELYNASGRLISLSGFTLHGNLGSDRLPGYLFEPGAFVIVAATERFREDYPGVRVTVIYLADGRFGNGLSNSGDRLILRSPAGVVIDGLSYGSDDTVFRLPLSLIARGHTYERRLAGLDRDTVSDFVDNPSPSPGASFGGLPPISMQNTLFLPLVQRGNGSGP